MDFLNKTFAQLKDLFSSMTPGARITAGLLLVVVVVSLTFLFRSQVSGPDVYLLNGEPVPASHVPAMEAAFAKANLNSYEVQGTRIRVPRGQQGAYMAALAEAKALPPNFGTALTRAVDGGNIFESPKQREQRMKIALQEELAMIIRSMKGIEGASVLLNESETKSGLGHEKVPLASVSIKLSGAEPFDDSRAASIRYLVAPAIGAKPENVTVIDLNGQAYRAPAGSGAEGEEIYAAAKQRREQKLKSEILDALKYVPNVSIGVNLELDPQLSSQSHTVKHEPKTVPIEIVDESTNETREGSSSGGRPGSASQSPANAPLAVNASGGKGTRDTKEINKRAEKNAVSSMSEVRETAGLMTKSARVSVGVPSSYFEKIWHLRNPAKEGEEEKKPDEAGLAQVRTEESAKIQKHVAALLPEVTGVTDRTELVTVTTFQDIKSDGIPAPSFVHQTLNWLSQHWSTLGLGGLGLVSLFVLRSMVRTAPAPEESSPMVARVAATPGEPQPQHAEAPEVVAARRLRRMTGSGPSLRDELSEMIQEDPDAAANILRAWIGHSN
jgi:flagellar M-ring protein FliF